VSDSRLRVHVLFEHGQDGRPFGSACLRLLRPFTHPAVARSVRSSCSRDYDGAAADVVIVDRLWRPDVSVAAVERLAAAVRRAGARLVLAFDDNLLDLAAERPDWADPERAAAWRRLLDVADAYLVTTPRLAERYAPLGRPIAVVPNALDERLLRRGRARRALRRLGRALRPTPAACTIGYMGTYTHDDDLRLVLPALRSVCARHGDAVRVEIVGVISDAATHEQLRGLPVTTVQPTPEQADYPAFVRWFADAFHWDIALAPLRDTPFTRCKSDVKHLDYAAIGAAGVYSRHPAYVESVRQGETGWLAADDPAEWAAALERWILHPTERRRVAAAARRYLWRERTLARTAARWPAALHHLLAACGAADGR